MLVSPRGRVGTVICGRRVLINRDPACTAGRAYKQERKGFSLTTAYLNASSFHSDIKRMREKSAIEGDFHGQGGKQLCKQAKRARPMEGGGG